MGGDTTLELVGRLGLAIAFGTAAVAKLRSRGAFARYLVTPFGRLAPPLAWGVIATESVLAGGLVAGWGQRWWSPAAVLFLIAATAFLAWRLIPVDDATCPCWGASSRSYASDDYSQNPMRQAVMRLIAPAWYGLRNGMLVAVTVALWKPTGDLGAGGAMLAFSICPVALLAGLLLSIGRRSRWLGRDDHPTIRAFASRLGPLVAPSWYARAATRLTPVGGFPWQIRAVRDSSAADRSS